MHQAYPQAQMWATVRNTKCLLPLLGEPIKQDWGRGRNLVTLGHHRVSQLSYIVDQRQTNFQGTTINCPSTQHMQHTITLGQTQVSDLPLS